MPHICCPKLRNVVWLEVLFTNQFKEHYWLSVIPHHLIVPSIRWVLLCTIRLVVCTKGKCPWMVLQKHFEAFMHNIPRYKCADVWINGARLHGNYYYHNHHGTLHISHWCSFEDQVRLIDLHMRCKTVIAWQGTGIVAPTNPVGRLNL